MLCCSADIISIWFAVINYGADGASEFLSLRLWSSSQGLSGCKDHCAPNFPPLLELSTIFLHYKNLCFAASGCTFGNLPKRGFTTDYFCFPAWGFRLVVHGSWCHTVSFHAWKYQIFLFSHCCAPAVMIGPAAYGFA